MTKYTVIQDFEIEFINYVEFQSNIFSSIDRHISRIHSEIRNYFLIMVAQKNNMVAEKFYLLTNFIKNWKRINSSGLVFTSSLMKKTDTEFSTKRANGITYNHNVNLVIYDSKDKYRRFSY